ncbi:anhydro-N-acetylmuramic acid kinase [Candidatus Rariloculus sp.]|uniref:anhydro-N-acetylmuramic acid kinase n=1 Tax=Candidatus Rariloculus sp. TaxID=3101265 RepID=UPI003D0FA5A2
MSELYVGLISGTSIDGVDAVLVMLDEHRCTLVHSRTTPYHKALHERVRTLIDNPTTTLVELGAVDVALGRFFAQCAIDLLDEAGVETAEVRAIGHHGQTVYHHPNGPEPFTLQLGDPNSLAARTGIATVADFRGLDVACGGQGAPLVPAFHEWLFGSSDEVRVVANIGGIANVTLLEPGQPTIGFDTGPGNTLLDGWISRCQGRGYDGDGRWAASGKVNEALLGRFLTEPYFSLDPPKSTGRELFNLGWTERYVHDLPKVPADADVQATLAELTAATVSRALDSREPDRLIVCGGGAHNSDVIARLSRLARCPVESSDAHGISPDWVEAAAFAWLARARLARTPGNVPTVTGADRALVLGGAYRGA